MSNDITTALSKLDSAISEVENGTSVGDRTFDVAAVRTYVEEARDAVDEVPALVDYANNWLDGVDFPADYGTFQEGRETVVGGSASGLPGTTTTIDIDHGHSLRVLRGRFALNDRGSPVFGVAGS